MAGFLWHLSLLGHCFQTTLKKASLVKHLKKQPLNLLKGDETSVKNAIKISFDLLTHAEHKEAFVLLSVLLGLFQSDAAEAVIEACSIPGTLPVKFQT